MANEFEIEDIAVLKAGHEAAIEEWPRAQSQIERYNGNIYPQPPKGAAYKAEREKVSGHLKQMMTQDGPLFDSQQSSELYQLNKTPIDKVRNVLDTIRTPNNTKLDEGSKRQLLELANTRGVFQFRKEFRNRNYGVDGLEAAIARNPYSEGAANEIGLEIRQQTRIAESGADDLILEKKGIYVGKFITGKNKGPNEPQRLINEEKESLNVNEEHYTNLRSQEAVAAASSKAGKAPARESSDSEYGIDSATEKAFMAVDLEKLVSERNLNPDGQPSNDGVRETSKRGKKRSADPLSDAGGSAASNPRAAKRGREEATRGSQSQPSVSQSNVGGSEAVATASSKAGKAPARESSDSEYGIDSATEEAFMAVNLEELAAGRSLNTDGQPSNDGVPETDKRGKKRSADALSDAGGSAVSNPKAPKTGKIDDKSGYTYNPDEFLRQSESDESQINSTDVIHDQAAGSTKGKKRSAESPDTSEGSEKRQRTREVVDLTGSDDEPESERDRGRKRSRSDAFSL